jgi:hypothetical protein
MASSTQSRNMPMKVPRCWPVKAQASVIQRQPLPAGTPRPSGTKSPSGNVTGASCTGLRGAA